MSQNSYLIEFCALMSQIVFLTDLTVLRLFTTVLAETSKNSYLLEFCAQVSKIVFLADLTVLQIVRTVWQNYHKTDISASSMHKYEVSCF